MVLGRRLELAVIACLIKLVSIVVDRAKAKRTIRQHVGKSVAAPSVRLLGANGAAANVGLLQVRERHMFVSRSYTAPAPHHRSAS